MTEPLSPDIGLRKERLFFPSLIEMDPLLPGAREKEALDFVERGSTWPERRPPGEMAAAEARVITSLESSPRSCGIGLRVRAI